MYLGKLALFTLCGYGIFPCHTYSVFRSNFFIWFGEFRLHTRHFVPKETNSSFPIWFGKFGRHFVPKETNSSFPIWFGKFGRHFVYRKTSLFVKTQIGFGDWLILGMMSNHLDIKEITI